MSYISGGFRETVYQEVIRGPVYQVIYCTSGGFRETVCQEVIRGPVYQIYGYVYVYQKAIRGPVYQAKYTRRLLEGQWAKYHTTIISVKAEREACLKKIPEELDPNPGPSHYSQVRDH
jgi:hypothetical protein